MYKFYINRSLYFDMPAVRDKISAIKTVISTTKYIIIGAARKSRRQANDVEVIMHTSGRMRRVIYCINDKFISMAFPFDYKNNKFFFNGVEVDNEVISIINSFIECEHVSSACNFSLEALFDHDANLVENQNAFFVFIGLLMSEDGYIRYDFDPEHDNGFRHPACHLDLNYSTPASFKLGLQNSISCSTFMDIVDNGKDRKVLRV